MGSEPGTSLLRVLLVDHDEHDRVAFRHAFNNSDEVSCEIIECRTSSEALELIHVNSSGFDLAVIEHFLPDMTGMELCRNLLDSGTPFPLVMLTGGGSEQLAVEAIKAGVSDYIIKDTAKGYLNFLPLLTLEVVREHRNRLKREVVEAAARENNFRLSQILHRIPVPTFVIDKDHLITHWNKALENLTGLSAAEMIGTRDQWRSLYQTERPLLADLIVSNVSERTIADFFEGKSRKSTRIEATYEIEAYFPDSSAGGKWLFCTASPLTDSDGGIIGAIETLQDITEHKRAEEELRQSEQRYREMSITDSLTKLYNSRHFFRQLAYEVEHANRYKIPLSLLLLDIDNFKRYNDTYGHPEGDNVLKALSAVIRKDLRSSDTAYRYGGEEFTVLFPDTEGGDALVVAERLRKEFEQLVLSPIKGSEVHMTVSIGVSQYIRDEDASTFLKRVDEAMYTAKTQGKNRTLLAASP
jgi:diguanylate cyclase (GGDEF)-like protein